MEPADAVNTPGVKRSRSESDRQNSPNSTPITPENKRLNVDLFERDVEEVSLFTNKEGGIPAILARKEIPGEIPPASLDMTSLGNPSNKERPAGELVRGIDISVPNNTLAYVPDHIDVTTTGMENDHRSDVGEEGDLDDTIDGETGEEEILSGTGDTASGGVPLPQTTSEECLGSFSRT